MNPETYSLKPETLTAYTCRFELELGAGGGQAIRYIAPHHKMDRSKPINITYVLPPGQLTDLLLLHINEGHDVMTKKFGRQPCLFMNRLGEEFSDQTFCVWWKRVLSAKYYGIHGFTPYFAANFGRRIFCEWYTAVSGYAAEEWSSAGACMGNGPKVWLSHYAPTVRQRMMQHAVDNHVAKRGAAAVPPTVATSTRPGAPMPPPPAVPMPDVAVDAAGVAAMASCGLPTLVPQCGVASTSMAAEHGVHAPSAEMIDLSMDADADGGAGGADDGDCVITHCS